jgi:glycosyltransferase involved in cell wall biosynthesis
VGSGPQQDSLRKLTLRSTKLQFLGDADYDTTRSLYHGQDLFFFPSLNDEWGLVVNEALDAGLPVLGSIHSQAVATLVRPGVNGAIFDPLEPNSFASAVAQIEALLSGDPRELRERCWQSVSQLTPKDIAEKISRLALPNARN